MTSLKNLTHYEGQDQDGKLAVLSLMINRVPES